MAIHIGGGIYSFLSASEIKELKRCAGIAFPAWSRQKQWRSIACRPTEARKFMAHPSFQPDYKPNA